jgi:hypothetical protein
MTPSTVGTRRRFGPGTTTSVMSESVRPDGTGAAEMDEEGLTGASRRPCCNAAEAVAARDDITPTTTVLSLER